MDGIYILHFQLMWKYGEELCVVNNFQISDACPSIFIGNGFALGSVKLHKTHISHKYTPDSYLPAYTKIVKF